MTHTPNQEDRTSLRDLTQDVSHDVAFVGKNSEAGSGAPVLILEEAHNSRSSLIENAIVLTRLYRRFGLRDIALEGYLKDGQILDAGWYTDRSFVTPLDRARVAVRLLKEGEISAPEFMRLSFTDVNLIPAEISSEYKVTMRKGAISVMAELARKARGGNGGGVLNNTKDSGANSISAEIQVRYAEDLERRRISSNITLSRSALDDWESYLSFWRCRAAANRTIMDAALSAPNSKYMWPVGINVGAAHTEGLGDLLSVSGRPHAVITPAALRNNDFRGDINRNYSFKEKQQSVQQDGLFMSAIDRSLRLHRRHNTPQTGSQRFTNVAYTLYSRPNSKSSEPQPVINESWFQAKATVYQFADALALHVLGAGSNSIGGEPPFGFSQSEFSGNLVRVDLMKVTIISNGVDKAVLFPVTLNPGDSKHAKTFWMKAIIYRQLTPDVDDGAITESMLKQALEQVRSEQDAPAKAEDLTGAISVSPNVKAVFTRTKEQAMAKLLRSYESAPN
jgi:hypothetical protein